MPVEIPQEKPLKIIHEQLIGKRYDRKYGTPVYTETVIYELI